MVVVNDVVRGVFGRIEVVGASQLASAVVSAGVAGGVVVHRLGRPNPKSQKTSMLDILQSRLYNCA